MRKIAILGSTGSIGTQTLDIVRAKKDLKVEAIAAGSNIQLLEQQIREFHPSIAAVYDEEKAMILKEKVRDTDTEVLAGMDGIMAVSTAEKAELLVTAIVGMIGIQPTIAAIKAGKDIALANKETLVCAGHIIMPLAEKCGVSILPVDSEHSAIFQCLRGNKKNKIEKLLLTASGGPFRKYSAAKLRKVTPEDALKHPNWNMGQKVTIDSSTMVNKGLEIMEAHWLFGVDESKIQVVIQPQSIIHSMVEYRDGAVIAQLGTPDMKLPIQYALYYPKRRFLAGARLDFETLSGIEIAKPDPVRFPALRLAREACAAGGSLPTVFNAADEIAVAAFLKKQIRYTDISVMIENAMNEHVKHGISKDPDVEEILAVQKATTDWLKAEYKV